MLSNNVNATLSTNATIAGETSRAQDVRIFGPGSYVFIPDWIRSLSTNFGTTNLGGTPLNLTVGAGQIGMHGPFIGVSTVYNLNLTSPYLLISKHIFQILELFSTGMNDGYRIFPSLAGKHPSDENASLLAGSK